MPGGPDAPHDGWDEGGLLRLLWPVLLFFMLQSFLGQKPPPRSADADSTLPPTARLHRPFFVQGEPVELRLYLTQQQEWQEADFDNEDLLVWHTHRLLDSSIDPAVHTHNTQYMVDDYLVGNGSLWMHVFASKRGAELRPSSEVFDRTSVIHVAHPMLKFHPKKVIRSKHLLSNAETEEPETPLDTEEEVPWAMYWKPTLSLALVEDFSHYQPDSLPEQLKSFIQFDFDSLGWYPVLFINEFWLLQEHLIEVNSSLLGKPLPLNISYDPIGVMKWQMFVQMELNFQQQDAMGLGGGTEEVKRMLMDTNPWLLGLTLVVTFLHTIFDFLAFKNDIQFWRGKKDMKGLSIKTIMVNVVMQLIIFLYLCDNETSWMILASTGVGLIIEGWKITKACTASVTWWGHLPMLHLEDKESYVSETKEYDDKAMKYLGMLLGPLFALYTVYSLVYEKHKGWYSFVLNTLVGGIYMFGFIMMTPQLFINYKLKSVAHLPWRTFVYKALNTFIDDLFAFIIKMPTLHRLSCFRDDLIFLVYLYQRWIYPVDVKRVNEFGQGGEGQSFDSDTQEKPSLPTPTPTDPPSDTTENSTAAALPDQSTLRHRGRAKLEQQTTE